MIIENANADLPQDADICIVGAGPVGLALAWRCGEQGRSVLILEAGSADGGSMSSVLEHADVAEPHHAPISLTTHRGIGGTTRLWGGRCVPLDDIDFVSRAHVSRSGWPISHSEIGRYYDEALAFLGCHAAPPPPDARDVCGTITMRSIERWSVKPDLWQLHKEAFRTSPRIAVHTGCAVTGIRLSPDGAGVEALDVKRLDRSLSARADAYVFAGGGIENARLLLAAQRFWSSKFGGVHGPLGRYYSGHLTGYISAIEFSRPEVARQLWFRRCADGSHMRYRLAVSPAAQLKHGVLNTAFWPDSFSVSDPAHGSGALSLAYLVLAQLGLYRRLKSGLAPSITALAQRSYRQHLANMLRDPHLTSGAFQIMKQIAVTPARTRRLAMPNPRRRYLLRYHAEQAPHPENRVRLSEVQDGDASPRLRIDFRFQPQDVDSVLRAHELLGRWLQREKLGWLDYLSNADERSASVFRQAIDGYHQLGLTRMSDDPAQGVVNRDCRVHDVGNLFLAGSSVFPTAGHANPTLPAVALALRLGDHLCSRDRAAAPLREAPKPAAVVTDVVTDAEPFPRQQT